MIIYPNKPTIQTSNDPRWINLKSNLYNTYVNTHKMIYTSTVSGNTEVFELSNDYIWIKIHMSLMIKAGSNQTGVDIKKYNPLINNIKNIINRYYKNSY